MYVGASVILAIALLYNDRSIRGMGNPRGSFHFDSYFRRADAGEKEHQKNCLGPVSYTHLTLPTNREV